jgi:hemin uptake protein HemP
MSPSASQQLPSSGASSTAPRAGSSKVVSSHSPAPGVDSNEILKGEKAVAIHHNGLTYRLQATRLGKLILTK